MMTIAIVVSMIEGGFISLIIAVCFYEDLLEKKRSFIKWASAFLHRPNKRIDIPETFTLGSYKTSWVMIDGDGRLVYSPENITCFYEERFVNLPPEVSILKKKILKREQRNKSRGKPMMWNGPFLALQEYAIGRTADKENMSLALRFCSSDYYTFQATVMGLDKNIMKPPGVMTLRQKYLSSYDVSKPVDFLASGFGVSLIVRTKDRKILLTYRDNNLGARPGKLDVSVVEGVHPLYDRASSHKGPDLYRTAIRGLKEELGLDVAEAQISFLGFGVDFEYYQWQLLGVVRTLEGSEDIINRQRRGTEGKWEVKNFKVSESDPHTVFSLLNKEPIWSAGFVCVYLALVNEYGKNRVEREAKRVFR